MQRFSGLVRRITGEYRLGHADCADVSQFVWLKMFEHLRTVRSPERLGAWVAAVARNECSRLVRFGSREVSAGDWHLEDVSADTEDACLAVIMAERDALLWGSVREELNERGYAVIRMLMAEPPASYEQVSHLLDIPLGSIGPTRQRCLAQLRSNAGVQECRGMVAS